MTRTRQRMLLVAATLRVAFVLGVLQAILALSYVRAARAAATELLGALEPHVMRYADADRQDAPRRLFVNGLPIRFSAGFTAQDAVDVLDFFERRCDAAGVRWGAAVPGSAGAWLSSALGSLLNGVVRVDGAAGGWVACLDTGPVGPSQLLERVGSFVTSGDLAQVGALRLVLARREAQGTAFITLWTDGEVNVYEAFPAARDAPGRDIDGVARPAAAVRLLSAWEEGETAALVIYRSPAESFSRFAVAYRETLTRASWQLTGLVCGRRPTGGLTGGTENLDEATFLASQNGRTVVITLVHDGQAHIAVAVAASRP